MSNSNQDNSYQDRWLVLVAILMGALFVYKLFLKVKFWSGHHPFAMAGILTVVAMLGVLMFVGLISSWRKPRQKQKEINKVTSASEQSVYAGRTEDGDRVYLPLSARRMHAQVIGTTNAGKTESVILPWAVDDIRKGRGLILIDGKSDSKLKNKLTAYAKKFGRLDDLKVFSLHDVTNSCSFNPLLGGTPEEITERVFNAFEFDNPYYRSVQFEVLAQVMRIFAATKVEPTFLRIYQAIRNPDSLGSMTIGLKDVSLSEWALNFKNLKPAEREDRTSGLLSQLSHFSFGDPAKLYNTDAPHISIEEALSKNKILYFQLPVMRTPFLGKATGKLVLQALQSAISNRHRDDGTEQTFFSVFLDDFTEYLYPGFVTILNKSRSANVGVVFAHQALGDIKTLGDNVASSILTNSNLKVIMRGNDPLSAEYFAKVVGTKDSRKETYRQTSGVLGVSQTGEASVRETNEFIVHPDVWKRNLGVGDAVVIVPHDYGTKVETLHFEMLPDLPVVKVTPPLLTPPLGLSLMSTSQREGGDTMMIAVKNNLTSQPKDVL